MFLFALILFAVTLYFIFFVSQFYNVTFKNYPPFVSTDQGTINRIIAATTIDAEATVYELGCGRARFLRTVEKAYPKTRLIGLENLFNLYLIAKISLRLRGSKIQLIKGDFFGHGLKNADLIYCYLNNSTMAKLEKKFTLECRPGTQIISRSFSLPNTRPEQVLTIRNKKIFFYKIF